MLVKIEFRRDSDGEPGLFINGTRVAGCAEPDAALVYGTHVELGDLYVAIRGKDGEG